MANWNGLDRVIALEPGRGARALCNIPSTLSIFDSHFPRFPVFPGVLILGSLADLAARLLLRQTGRSWRLAAAERVRFRRFIQPGDQMEVAVELQELTDTVAVVSGAVRVEDHLTTTVGRMRLVPDETGGEA